MAENIVWGGSGIEKVVYDFILNNVTLGSIVVELGGGNVSTRMLGEKYNLYTIEHDINWLHKVKCTTYIYACIKDRWYNRDSLKKLPKNIELLFVDGPSDANFNGREGILKNYDLFPNCSKFLFHDTWRPKESQVAKELAKILNKNVIFYNEGNPPDYWAFLS
jgi:hypothetical protein